MKPGEKELNIIVVGMGKIGQKLVEYLMQEENHDITIIDTKHNVLQDMVNTYDVIGIEGSGANMETLKEAGIEKCDIVIAATGSDELNLLTCLIARKLHNCDTIARVRNPEYRKEIKLFKEDLGLAMIINPEYTAARQIARTLRFPTAIQIDNFAKGRVEIMKFKISPNSLLRDITIADISRKFKSEILICGVEREGRAYIPSGDFILRENDKISVVATLKNAEDFIRNIGVTTNRVKDTMIVGGGKTAVYLADILLKSRINVKIIEQDAQRCNELCSLVPNATVINGDGTECNLLLEEGLETCDSFVSLTNIDEENVMLSLYAQSKTQGKVITKINRIAFDEVVSNIGLDTVISPKDLTAESVVKFVRAKNNSIGNNIETMHYVLDDKAEALEFRIVENSPIANKAIESLELKKDIIVACINRNGNIIIPRGKDIILANDTVIVVTTQKGFTDIRDILR